MILKMFAVYDSKVEAYLTPHFMRSRGEALRAYTQASNDPNSQFAKTPADFTFFEIGEYDDASGNVKMYETKFSLGTALEFQNKEV